MRRTTRLLASSATGTVALVGACTPVQPVPSHAARADGAPSFAQGDAAGLVALVVAATLVVATSPWLSRRLDRRGYRYEDEQDVRPLPSRWVVPAVCSSAVVVAVVGFREWPWTMTLAWLAYVPWAVSLAHIDLDVRRLPNRIVMPAWWISLAVVAVGTWPWGDVQSLTRSTMCAGGAFVALFVLAMLPGAQLGFGDVKVIFPCAALMGWSGISTAVYGVCCGFFLAAGYAVVLLAGRRADRTTTLALGPWLLAGSQLTVLMASAS